ncbi:uncharacterized protein A1O5_10843 [Cladophialophora psammophila CBS 110553]|uniref:Major facilitator superfamily (MFS) profile domain-containing protein n=1 Tax=Cladophialophora psammophila CBS 110553 TaxID=1182543 RepID=W9WDP2_9EURO|nr:uncharacterized protein A1O5_10843 [Cladophialophora psammophila CBS 110553]EXJ66227.1 hypothetical protein A1O5_10843 [Cladophialophora psammophila CBS 110553]
MGTGVLEPKQDVVQGAVHLFDDNSVESTDRDTTIYVKHSRDGKVVLAPQPSDDPFGYRHIFDSALARSFGKRGLFVVSGLSLVVADAWATCASSYKSLLGARILSGAGQIMFEGNGLSIVPDLSFLHERGKRAAIFLLCSQTGVTLGTPLATQIAMRYGMKWCFGGFAIAEAIMTLATFFLFADCAYAREHVDALAHQDEQEIMNQAPEEPVKTEHVDTIESAEPIPKKTYLRQLSLYSGRVSSSHLPLSAARWHLPFTQLSSGLLFQA